MAKESWHYHHRDGEKFFRSGRDVDGSYRVEIKHSPKSYCWMSFKDLHDVAVFLASAAEAFGLRAVVADDTGEVVRPEESK